MLLKAALTLQNMQYQAQERREKTKPKNTVVHHQSRQSRISCFLKIFCCCEGPHRVAKTAFSIPVSLWGIGCSMTVKSVLIVKTGTGAGTTVHHEVS